MSKVKKSSEMIIFQTMGYDNRTSDELEKDYRECLELSADEAVDDTKVYSFFCERANDDFNDEMRNLGVETSTDILAIASIGRWNGRFTGYKTLGYKLNEILSVFPSCDDFKLYADRWNIRGEGSHHDGTNTVLFRRWKCNVSDLNMAKVLDALYDQKDEADSLVKRYTVSIRSEIANIYGW